MIPQQEIIAWRNTAPWAGLDQVEYDLVLSKALCELYQDKLLRENLIFRGGTALHKLFFHAAGRFSEDLDFVQSKAKPIGTTIDTIREYLDPWLGKPNWKQSQGRFTLSYRFKTEIEPVLTRKVKIEINTREHYNCRPYLEKPLLVESRWYQGEAKIMTYCIEELLATKLRALYQRKKGRDLYDFWYATNQITNLNIETVIDIFHHYMQMENKNISRAEFEKNLRLKQESKLFNEDIKPLLKQEQRALYKTDEAYKILFQRFLPKLMGESYIA